MSRERVPNGIGAAKENDLRPISNRISGTMKRFLLKNVRDRGGI